MKTPATSRAVPGETPRAVRLDCGLRVAIWPMHGRESVSAGLWIGTGSRHESAQLCGIAHFLEHMVFKGTRKRSALEISRDIEGRGGGLNAFTGEESTCIYTRTAGEDLPLALDVLFDLHGNARLARDDLERERDVILEEVVGVFDIPSQLVQERLNAVLWPGHALGRPIEGTPRSVRRIGIEDLVRFHSGAYVPANSLLSVAGAVDPDELVDLVERLVDGAAAGRPQRSRRYLNRVRSPRIDILAQDTEQTHLALGFRGFSRRDPRRYATRLLSVILGENMSSRLFRAVREKHGIAYDIHSSLSFLDDTGAFVVSAGLRNAKLEAGLEVILRELRRIRSRPPSRHELERACHYAVGQFRIAMEGTGHRMTWLGEHLLAAGRVPDADRTIARLRAVTAEDVRAAAAALFRDGRLAVAMIGPIPSAGLERVESLLRVGA